MGAFRGSWPKSTSAIERSADARLNCEPASKKKGVPQEQLPSPSSATGQRLGRQVRQDINRAVNEMLADHADARIVYEEQSVASMRFKARTMNAYLYASNLGRIPEQLAWATAKRGMAAHMVKARYPSQECSRCHYVIARIDRIRRRSVVSSVAMRTMPITTLL